MTRRLVVPLATGALVALAGLAACFSDKNPTGLTSGAACSPRGPYMGEFEGTLTGVATDSVAGCAYFVVQQVPACGLSEPSYSFQLVLSNGRLGRFEHAIALARCGQRPPTGTYTVGSSASGLLRGRVVAYGSNKTYDASSGTMELTASSPGTIAGTVTLTAMEVGGTSTITLVGTFSARCFDPNTPMRSDEGKPDDTYIGPCHARFAA